MMKRIAVVTALCLAAFALPLQADELAEGFLSPPKETQPGCYWYHFKDDVTKEGITKDLEAMARIGIGRAFIGYINQGANPVGDNQVLSEKWWDRLEHMFLEADRVGVDIGLFNCPGWSQSGGPWITPERSMRNLVDTEVTVSGPARFDGMLPGRDGYFETVKVLAFPAPAEELIGMGDFGLKVEGPRADPNQGPFQGGTVGFRSTLRQAGDPGNPAGDVRAIVVRDAGGKALYESDFASGLRGWRNTGGAKVEDGVLLPRDTDNPPMHVRRLELPAAFTIETEVKLNPDGVLGLAFGLKDASNLAFWQIRKGLLRPHVMRMGHYDIREIEAPALVEGEWLAIRIEVRDKEVKTYIGGALVNTYTASEGGAQGMLDALFDNDPTTTFTFPELRGGPFEITFHFERPFPVQSLIATPASGRIGFDGELLASNDGKDFDKVCDVGVFHGHQGVKIADPMVAAVPATEAKHYKLRIARLRDNRTYAALELNPRAMLEKYAIKQLGDIHPTPHPFHGTYEWDAPAEPARGVLDPAAAIDLTDRVGEDGHITWDVPAGDWVVARFGMVTTGSKNGPAMPDATGLEVDKMSAVHTRFHFDSYVGRILERIPAENRKRFKYVIQDSYETGPQNWTDGLIEIFHGVYGYDPTPYLPVTSGRIVGSAAESERFLWDLRRLVADMIGDEYVKGLSEASEAEGLLGWLENYGHWGFPAEFLQYGKNSSEVGGEFWLESDLGTIECRPPASAAHIYGKDQVYAEAFTSGIRYIQSPRSHFKHYGDWAFAEGINHFIFHVYIHQPRDDERPGVDAGFGTNFSRHNTIFNQLDGFVVYSQRANYLLSRGSNVADVCYFIGEGGPKMDGPRKPALPRGYDFDFVNGDVILNRMVVKDGRMQIPGGPAYKVMVLPDVDTMRPEIAAKLKAFAAGGAVICGPRPVASPSLQNYPACDAQVAALAEELWGGGVVLPGDDLRPAIAAAGLTPDFAYTLLDDGLNAQESPDTDLTYASGPQRNSLRFAHRRDGGTEIYFVTNMQQDRGFDARCAFRAGHKQPEIWNPVTGDIRDAKDFQLTEHGVELTMRFAPQQSFFFLFRKPVSRDGGAGDNVMPVHTLLAVEGPWTVAFDPAWGGPAKADFPELVSWHERPEEGIKYYSGEATYATTFGLDAAPEGRAWLGLGRVAEIADVTLNGKPVGNVWVEPWRIEVTGLLRSGENTLEVTVANTWNNRLLGDAEGKGSFTKHYTGWRSRGLMPAGLLGPVTLEVAR